MKKVIVSGAAGFIGNAVARELIKRGIKVVAVVKPETAKSEEAFRLKDFEATVVECDLKEMEVLPQLIADREFDAFYQFAWDGTDKEALLDYNRQIANIFWTINSINAAVKLKCRRFVGAGSITQRELDFTKGRAFTDDRHKYYRAAQLSSEVMGRAVAREKGIAFLWPVIINVYGEGEIAPRLISNMIRNLLQGKKQSFSAGEQLYDFLHIEDAAKAFYLIGESGLEDVEYVVGSGNAKPLKEYLKIIRNVVAPQMDLGLGELEFHGLEMTEEMLNIETLIRDTGFIPNISFEKGIERTMQWIKWIDEDKR